MDKIVDTQKRASESILVTGATGCVGSYIVDELLATTPHQVVALTRSIRGVNATLQGKARVTLVEGDVREGERLVARLPRIDRAILAATSWEAGEASHAVNVDGQVACARALVAQGARRIVWFGTASILEGDGSPLGAAERLGTPYIVSKALARRQLLEWAHETLSILHPTLVVGGSVHTPWSHVAKLFPEIERRAWLARLVTGAGSFHFVHARDLACLARELVCAAPNESPSEVIAGAPATSLREVLDLVLARRGVRRLAEFELTPRRIAWLLALFRISLEPWDRYCLERRHFVYDRATLTLLANTVAHFPSTRSIIDDIPRDLAVSASRAVRRR